MLPKHLKHCPMGFALRQNEDGKYLCNLCSCKCCFENIIIKSCKLDNQSSVIVKKENTWIGHEQVNGEMSFISGDCSLDYCNKNKEVELEQQDLQCNHNRSGIMCGLCPSGWSMMLGTSRWFKSNSLAHPSHSSCRLALNPLTANDALPNNP